MNERTIKKIFYRFLREERAFTYFFKNLHEDYGDESNEQLYDTLRKYPTELINYAFTWRDTPQGQGFWEDLHNKWKDIYRKASNYFYNNI